MLRLGNFTNRGTHDAVCQVAFLVEDFDRSLEEAVATTFVWTDKNVACVATYNILEGDQLLNQFDRVFLSFSKAGAVLLCTLPYFPKFRGAADDIEGRAAQMARQYFKFLITLYTNRKERPADTIEKMLGSLAALFASKTATIADLAQAADGFLKFKGEPGGPA